MIVSRPIDNVPLRSVGLVLAGDYRNYRKFEFTTHYLSIRNSVTISAIIS